jgi:cytochrome c553
MPDLRDRLSVSSHSSEQTYLIIKDGGEAHGLCDKMIPAGRRLTDQDIRDLTAYVLTLPAYEYIRRARTH